MSCKHGYIGDDLESCNLMCTYTVVTDPCDIPSLAQARPMMLCIYTSLLTYGTFFTGKVIGMRAGTVKS